MRAAVLTRHGGPEVLDVLDLPTPNPGAGQVRLRVHAAALNRLDLWVREGWKGLDLAMPHVIGGDGAGVVDALGPGVSGFSVGDRVCVDPLVLHDPSCAEQYAGRENLCPGAVILGEHVPGLAAEYAVVPARNLLALPTHVPYHEAAAAGLVFVTAWHSLVTRGGLRPGETVLIVGAGGGANSAYLQIARLGGARVIVVGSDADKCAQARALGADDTIDRSATPEWSRAVYTLTGKRGADIVVDNVGQATLMSSVRAVARGGRILVVGNTSGPLAELDMRFVFSKHISIIGSTMGTHHDYVTVMQQVFRGTLKPVVGARLPLDQFRVGHDLLEHGGVFGKVVLDVVEAPLS